MALTNGTLFEISVNMTQQGNRVTNVWSYRYVSDLGAVTPVDLLAGWWTYAKAGYRNIVNVDYGVAFLNLQLSELGNPAGVYAEYAIPVGERSGTRPSGSDPQYTPSFAAVGVRLTVGTRVTRPGQKRFAFLTQGDFDGNTLLSGMLTAVNTFMDGMVNTITLVAPAIGVTIQPVVVRKDATGAPTAHQDVTGYLTNAFVTSQVSRKHNRGV